MFVVSIPSPSKSINIGSTGVGFVILDSLYESLTFLMSPEFFLSILKKLNLE